MYVCLCYAVSDSTIARAIREGARTVADVGRACKAGTDCGQCRSTIEHLLMLEAEPASLPGHPDE